MKNGEENIALFSIIGLVGFNILKLRRRIFKRWSSGFVILTFILKQLFFAFFTELNKSSD